MVSHKYEKPKEKVIKVYRGKELEDLLGNAMKNMFLKEGIKITPKKVRRFLDLIPESALGGNVVLIVELMPLNSMRARGKFNELVYQVVRKTGTQYAKKYKKPRNPRTPSQQANRSKISPALSAWRSLTERQKAGWNKKAGNSSKSGYNLFISSRLSNH